METRIIKLCIHGDSRGKLVAIEQIKDVPFEVKRVYYMYDTTQGVRRGFHAHKQLQQVLICVSGECKILLDDGKEKQVVILSKPDEGLVVLNGVWHEMFDFSENAVLLVLASDYFAEDDYIRNYKDFINKRGSD